MAQTVRIRKTRVTRTRKKKNGTSRGLMIRKPSQTKRKVTIRSR